MVYIVLSRSKGAGHGLYCVDLNDDELKLLYSYDFIPFKEFPKPNIQTVF